MNSRLLIALVIFLLSCKKEKVVFNSDVTTNYEIPLILNFDGKNCLYDESIKVFKYAIDENSLSKFSPFTIFQNYSEIKLNNQSLLNNSVNHFNNLKLNTLYDLEISTAGKVKYFQIIFKSLPLVQIIVVDEIQNNAKILGKMVINYADPSLASLTSYIGIEIRGKYTAGLKKKSYGIKPLGSMNIKDNVVKTFFDDMEANNKWSLDGMYADKSKLRNHISFSLWNSLSNVSIKAQYVEVFINNKSFGLYRFGENYTETLLKLGSSAVLYTGIDNTEITKFEEIPSKTPKSVLWKEWEQVYPNPSYEIKWNDFYSMTKLIVTESDNKFIADIGTYLDLDNVIDYYLFMNLCYGYDNVGKNWYFLKRSETEKFKILLWDLDATWGRMHNGSALDYNLLINNQLFERLLELNPDEFKQNMKERWDVLRLNQFSEVQLLALFEEHFVQLNNMNMITNENRIWDLNENLTTEKAYIYSWLQSRLAFLDQHYNDL